MNKIEIGSTGEYFVSEYLANNGYRVIERNYREKFDEIDIVAFSKNGMLVFCEVKTFLGEYDSYNNLVPEDNMTYSKIKKIKRACEVFVGKHQNILNEKIGWRIDCATVTINSKFNDYKINYYENI